MRLIAILLLLAAGVQRLYGGDRLLNLAYGRYSTGIARQQITSGAATLIITAWYPAVPSSAGRLTLRDCFLMDGIENNLQTDSIIGSIIGANADSINKHLLLNLLNTKTSTADNAMPVNKRFPVICWSSRHGTVYYQFAMSEYLASHGFVVYCVSQVKPAPPLPWELEAGQRPVLLQQYVANMQALIKYIKDQPLADTTKMALFSWSYGGETAILTQQAHPEIKVVFGFSSINFEKPFFVTQGFENMLIPGKLAVPYNLFYEDTNRFGEKYNASVLHPAHRRVSILFQFPWLLHGNFNFAEGVLPSVINLAHAWPWVKTGKQAILGYEAVCELSLWLLRYYFGSKNSKQLRRQISKIRSRNAAGIFKQTV